VRGTIISLYTIADCLQLLGRYPAALASLDEARLLAEKAGQKRDLSNILLLTALTYEKTRDFPRALAYHRRYHDLWANLFDEEKTRQTAEMQTRYEVEKKQRENELLKREKQIGALALAKGRNQRNFLFFVALLVLVLAGMLYQNIRTKARANLWLEEANSRIVAQQGKLEKAYRQMEELARRDQLTGLPNRRAALEEIEREEKRFQRSQKPFTLVMADLNGFKAVNDTVGHDAGDFVLQAAAALFSGALRAQDVVARWGGDEFLLLLPETDAEGARIICAAFSEKIAGHDFSFNGRPLKVEISMGTGTFRAGGTIEECLHEADQAMYRSRRRVTRPPTAWSE
jgi:diguanylate cyclase (GGDEF)-like protein